MKGTVRAQRRRDPNSRRASAVEVVATVLASTGIALVLGQPAAQADAYGCAWADAAPGAANCISVTGEGTHVDNVRSVFQPGIIPWPEQICERQHEVTFTPVGADHAEVRNISPVGCILGLPGTRNDDPTWSQFSHPEFGTDFVDFGDLGELEDGSQVCTRAKNTRMNKDADDQHKWTYWACETVKADGWWWGD